MSAVTCAGGTVVFSRRGRRQEPRLRLQLTIGENVTAAASVRVKLVDSAAEFVLVGCCLMKMHTKAVV